MSRKKILSLMFCAALTVSIFGAEFKEGTYVGEAKGYRPRIEAFIPAASPS